MRFNQVIIFIVVSLAAFGCSKSSEAPKTASTAGADANTMAEPIRIGDINPYSRWPQNVEAIRTGGKLALDEINAAGGIKSRPLEIVYRDTKGQPDEAVRVAEELIEREGVVLLHGPLASHSGLAVSGIAERRKIPVVVSVALSDNLVWKNGNRYTFQPRNSVGVHATMLAEEAAKLPATRWAVIALNYEFGQSAIAAFKVAMKKLRPDVAFVGEQWPPLGKMDAGATIAALELEKPEAVVCALVGGDIAEFVREGQRRNFFEGREVVSLAWGWPTIFNSMGGNAPHNWIIMGFPHDEFTDPDQRHFVASYHKTYGAAPTEMAFAGYRNIHLIAKVLEAAPSLNSEDIVDTLEGFETRLVGEPYTMRAIDHQSTSGVWIGRSAVVNGEPKFVNWKYHSSAGYMPSDEWIRSVRPQ